MVTRVPLRLPDAASVRAQLHLTSAMLRRTLGLASWELALVHHLAWFGS